VPRQGYFHYNYRMTLPEKRAVFILVFWLLAALALAGCSAQPAKVQGGGYVTGATVNEPEAGEQQYFNVQVVRDNDPVGIDFRGGVQLGSLTLELKDSQGRVVFEQEVSESAFKINQVTHLPAGEYRLVVAWPAAALANFNLEWQPGEVASPALTPMVFVPGVGMLLVGIGFASYGVRRGGWRFLLLGGLFWLLTVALKFAAAIPANASVYKTMLAAVPGQGGQLVFSLYVGLLTGLTEVLITWLVVRYTRLRQTPWLRALAFGVGFGALEAILLGVGSISGMATAMLLPAQLPASTFRAMAAANNLLFDLAPVLERFFTIWVHIFCAVLIFYAAASKQVRWFWLAFACKSLLDAVAGYAQLSGQLESLSFLWTIEAVVAVFGGLSWWGTERIRERYSSADALPEPAGQV
jgi:uncharacterized membrane protein YhfC